MRIPNGERAVVDLRKIREYCLSPTHPRGRHKARVFASALGLTEADAQRLRKELLRAVVDHDAVPGEVDEYGRRFVIDFEMVGTAGKAVVRSFWIVLAWEDFPRLTSCFVR